MRRTTYRSYRQWRWSGDLRCARTVCLDYPFGSSLLLEKGVEIEEWVRSSEAWEAVMAVPFHWIATLFRKANSKQDNKTSPQVNFHSNFWSDQKGNFRKIKVLTRRQRKHRFLGYQQCTHHKAWLHELYYPEKRGPSIFPYKSSRKIEGPLLAG